MVQVFFGKLLFSLYKLGIAITNKSNPTEVFHYNVISYNADFGYKEYDCVLTPKSIELIKEIQE